MQIIVLCMKTTIKLLKLWQKMLIYYRKFIQNIEAQRKVISFIIFLVTNGDTNLHKETK